MAIDPRQARTDIYGQGKGEAQVFQSQQRDLLVREARQVAEQQATAKAIAKKQAATAKATGKLQKESREKLSDIRQTRVKSGDLGDITEGTKLLQEKFRGAVGPGGKVDPVKFDQAIAYADNLALWANNSAAQKEDIFKKKESAFYQGEIDALDELERSPGRHIERLPATGQFDIRDDLKSNVVPFIQDKIKTGGYGTTFFRLPQAEKEVEDRWNSNPAFKMQGQAEFVSENPEVEPTEEKVKRFTIDKHAPVLVAEYTKNLPIAYIGGGPVKEADKPIVTYNPVSGAMTVDQPAAKDQADRTVSFIVDPSDSSKKIGVQLTDVQSDPETGKIFGGTGTIVLSPEQKQENARVQSKNDKKAVAFIGAKEERLLFNPKPIKKTGFFTDESDVLYKKRLDEWQKKYDEWASQYDEEPDPHQTGSMELTSAQAQNMAHGKYGVNIPEVIKKKGRGTTYKFGEVQVDDTEPQSQPQIPVSSGIKWKENAR